MSDFVNLYQNYAAIDFPGPQGLQNPKVDRFIDLTDSLVTDRVREDQRAWAQVYNKMANAVNEIQTWFWFEAATQQSSGVCGEGTYVLACSSLVSVVPSGDGTVRRIYPPTEFRILLSDLVDFASPMYVNHGATGSVLFFEVVVTKNATVDYSNMPFSDQLLATGQSSWDQIIGGGQVVVAAALAPVRTNGVPTAEPWNYATVTPTRYRNVGYIHALRVTCHAVRTNDHYIVRGCVYDLINQQSSTNNYTIWKNNGANIELVVTITKVGL